jgi:hypothetical protein
MKKNEIVISIFSPHMGRKLLVGHSMFFLEHGTKNNFKLKRTNNIRWLANVFFLEWIIFKKLFICGKFYWTTQYLNQGIHQKILNLILGFGFGKGFLNLNNGWVKSNQFWKGLWWKIFLIKKIWLQKKIDDSYPIFFKKNHNSKIMKFEFFRNSKYVSKS